VSNLHTIPAGGPAIDRSRINRIFEHAAELMHDCDRALDAGDRREARVLLQEAGALLDAAVGVIEAR
jgi:hypothetical protein